LCEPQWLKYNSEPWTDVVEHWEASRLARIKDMTIWNENVQLFFTKWPILKHPQSYILVNIFGSNIIISKSSCRKHVCDYLQQCLQIESDYVAQFGNVLSIYNKWPQFSQKIYTLMQTEIKDKIYKGPNK